MKQYKNITITVIIFILIYIGLSYGLIKPQIMVFRERYISLKEKKNQIVSLAEKKDSLAKLHKDKSKIETALQKIETSLPQGKQTSDFIVQLEGATNDTGNALQSISLKDKEAKAKTSEEEGAKKEEKPTEEEKPYKSMNFSVSIDGDFQQLVNFLILSNNITRFNSISALSITANTSDNLIKTKIDGEMYYR